MAIFRKLVFLTKTMPVDTDTSLEVFPVPSESREVSVLRLTILSSLESPL